MSPNGSRASPALHEAELELCGHVPSRTPGPQRGAERLSGLLPAGTCASTDRPSSRVDGPHRRVTGWVSDCRPRRSDGKPTCSASQGRSQLLTRHTRVPKPLEVQWRALVLHEGTGPRVHPIALCCGSSAERGAERMHWHARCIEMRAPDEHCGEPRALRRAGARTGQALVQVAARPSLEHRLGLYLQGVCACAT